MHLTETQRCRGEGELSCRKERFQGCSRHISCHVPCQLFVEVGASHPIKKKTVYTLFHVYVKMPNLKPHTFYNGEKQESKEGREVKKGQ